MEAFRCNNVPGAWLTIASPPAKFGITGAATVSTVTAEPVTVELVPNAASCLPGRMMGVKLLLGVSTMGSVVLESRRHLPFRHVELGGHFLVPVDSVST